MRGRQTVLHPRTIENATLLPLRDLHLGFARAGVYGSDGDRLDLWPLLVAADSRVPVAPRHLRETAEDSIDGGCIYGGLMNPRIGHFITETVPNFVAIADACRTFPDHTLLFHCWTEMGEDQMQQKSFIPFFLDLFGLADRAFKLVMRPLKVASLVVPEAPFLGKFKYKPWLPDRLDSWLPALTSDAGEKVYLSRTKLKAHKDVRLTDEPRVEAIYRERGYESVHMQNLPLVDQISIVRQARHLAGPQGTAIHWSLYSKRVETVVSMGYKSGLQAGICDVRGQRYFNPRGIIANPFAGGRKRWFSDRAIHGMIDAAEAADD